MPGDHRFLLRPGQPDRAEDRRRAEESVALGHAIQLEDAGICEDVQRGLASRTYDTGRFSLRREAGVLHFHRLLAARFGSEKD
jgi:choline monooxygenase